MKAPKTFRKIFKKEKILVNNPYFLPPLIRLTEKKNNGKNPQRKKVLNFVIFFFFGSWVYNYYSKAKMLN